LCEKRIVASCASGVFWPMRHGGIFGGCADFDAILEGEAELRFQALHAQEIDQGASRARIGVWA
jgi:hypothetical protein